MISDLILTWGWTFASEDERAHLKNNAGDWEL